MWRLIFALTLAALLSFATAAGAGDSGDSGDDFDFGVMTFDDLPEDAPTPTLPALALRESWVVEVGYVHQQQVTVEGLRRVVRDLRACLKRR